MVIFWPIMLFSNAQKFPNNAQEVYTFNSQYIAHYAQVDYTIIE